MNEIQAGDLAALLKGLMPMLTIDQGFDVRAMLLKDRRADYIAAEAAIREYAHTETVFSLASFRSRCVMRSILGETTYDRTCRELSGLHQITENLAKFREHIDRSYESIVAGLSDEAIAKLTRDAVDHYLVEPSRFKSRLIEAGKRSRTVRTFVVGFMDAHSAQEMSR